MNDCNGMKPTKQQKRKTPTKRKKSAPKGGRSAKVDHDRLSSDGTLTEAESSAKQPKQKTPTRRKKSAPKGGRSTPESSSYKVQMLPMSGINPSPENDDLYGGIKDDDGMRDLVASIRDRGLSDPLRVTKDGFILSGHRRYHAMKKLGNKFAPCFVDPTCRIGNRDFHAALAEFNPQRVKTVGSVLKEALLRDRDEDAFDTIEHHRAASCQVDAEFKAVPGSKNIKPISPGRMPFLEAAKKVIFDLQEYWPLNVRQVHYNLLNDPPRKFTRKGRMAAGERRYKNDKQSYKSLVDLLTSARYVGLIPFEALDDPTRPHMLHGGWDNVDEFVREQIDDFLCGFYRNRQRDQPRHLEILGEKGTLMSILRRVSREYHVPMTLARGYAGPSIWKKIVDRFKESGKERLSLIVVSDFDPEGLDLAEDAVRSIRDMWQVPIDYHRVGVTREQIDELNLAEDFNPAKASSTRLAKFVKETGGNRTWECEALPPKFLIRELEDSIESNMDMDIYDEVCERESDDRNQLREVRKSISEHLVL